VTILIDKDVLRFDVSVQHVVLMQIAHSSAHLNEVNPCLVFVHAFDLTQLVEQFTAWAVLHPKANPTFGLESTLDFAHEFAMRSA
jgi:hypothetical protein